MESNRSDFKFKLGDIEFYPTSSPPEPHLLPTQLCAWSARALASLQAHSRKEDRFGVAQLSGSNADVISTLVSCLLAVEAFMGKKTNLQPRSQFMGPPGIKRATPNAGGRVVVAPKKKNGPVYAQAYALADVLRTSIYWVVSAFHDDMIASAKSGLLEKDWVTSQASLWEPGVAAPETAPFHRVPSKLASSQSS